ncbi:MAG: thiamine pyrophosphate-requiring protein [Pseudomonadota bacterium]
MNGADLIAQILKKEGVEILPVFPHSDLIDSCAKLGIRPIVVRQERQALHIAHGYARMLSGEKICATGAQYGPGSENAMGAVAQCFADNVPVLHMPGGYLLSEQGTPPNFNAARNMQHINKWCEMVYQVERLPHMLQNAFALLRNGRPGPVTLEVPHDLFTAEVDPGLLDLYRPQRRSRPLAGPAEVGELLDMMLGAKAPVIIAGQGMLYGDACAELIDLVELTQIPVATTLNGKSAFPENHPLSLGTAACSRPDHLLALLNKADVIVGLGTSFTRSDYITPFPTKGRRFAQLTNWEGDLSKDYPIDLGVIGDAKTSLGEILKQAQARLGAAGRDPAEGPAAEIAAAKERFLAQWRPLLESDETPINPYRVVWDVTETLRGKKAVATHDAGSPRDQITPFFESTIRHGYIGWGKTTQLGLGLGLMQGAKLARPDWACVNVMGDAAIGMVGMDLETGVRNRIGTTSVVLKNSVMGGYTSYHPAGAELYNIHELGGDYADMARALGCHGERVTEPAEIKPALSRALAANEEGQPALVEVITSEEGRMAKNLPEGL